MSTKSRPFGGTSAAVATVVGKAFGLPAQRNRVLVTKGVQVPMRDGVLLVADHYAPVSDHPRPTVLVRSAIGRANYFGLMYAQLYATRGYHVVLQSVRGTFGSGGEYVPVVNEAADGTDTMEWLRGQDWFDGRLAMLGPSTPGSPHWSFALDPPPELKAMIVYVGGHDVARAAYGRGPFALQHFLNWSEMIATQEHTGMVKAAMRLRDADKRIAPTVNRLPLKGSADELLGAGPHLYDEWATSPDPDAPCWNGMRLGDALQRLSAPTLLFGGWHDVASDQTLEQYQTLRDRGVDVALTMGRWGHLDLSADFALAARESLAWLDAHVDGAPGSPRTAPLRIWIGGREEWRDLPVWPPVTTSRTWYLQGGGRLADNAPEDANGTTAFRYDPQEPTPSVGGRVMSVNAGAVDNTALEAREDVLTFTTEPLARAVEFLGAPVVELRISSDNPYADLFARICDVDAKGRSVNVTDQIVRLPQEAGVIRVIRLELAEIAHRFAEGHRIRLQVSGGAHPRYARNLGTAGPAGLGVESKPVNHDVHHNAAQVSSISLPVT
jgi:putative CocE/NonD family hydrolase